MQNYASKVSEGMALQLGCLELRYVLLGAWGAGAGGGVPAPSLGGRALGGSTWNRDVRGCTSICLTSLPSCRRFYKDMPQNALDKKSNFEFLE